MNSRTWLSSPHMGGNEVKYILDAFQSNWIAPAGTNISGFEEDLESYLQNGSHVAVLNSGTAALHIGLIMLGVKPGDEVICQSMTFTASANPIIYLGAKPIFIDSEPETWNICPVALETAVIDRITKGKKPKAIIAVSLYGMCYNVEAVRSIADKYGIPILEDSAEALGSTYKGEKCGTFGDIGVLSFNGNKIITTSTGGAIVFKKKELKEKAIFLSTQAKAIAPHYQHYEIGYNYRMSNICAGIGRGQMEVLDNHIELRREMHLFYLKTFKAINKEIEVLNEPDHRYKSNYWLTTILVDPEKTSGITRESIRLTLESFNIESRPIWKPLHLQPVFEEYPYYGGNVAETIFNNGLCLPSGSNLCENDKIRITNALKSALCVK